MRKKGKRRAERNTAGNRTKQVDKDKNEEEEKK
jgi:hypothetical protein